MDVRKSVLVGHSADEMFDVIEAAERYPEFLPWCARATIVARSDAEVVADIEVDFHGVRFGFRTRNPKRRPEWMSIHLEHGPFHEFGGTWNIAPLAADGCRVEFDFSYHFHSTPMARLARPVFDRIANTLVDRFVARAEAVCPGHGKAGGTSATASRDEPGPHDTRERASPSDHSMPGDADGVSRLADEQPRHRSDPP